LPKKYYDTYEASNRHPSRGDEAMKDLVHNIVEALVDHPDWQSNRQTGPNSTGHTDYIKRRIRQIKEASAA
jgi:hypothetical protein